MASLEYTEDDLANTPSPYNLNNFTPYYGNVSAGNAMDSVTKLLQSRASQSPLSPTYYTNEYKKIDNNSFVNPTDDDTDTSTTSGWDLFNTSMKGINGLVNAGLGINNAVQGWMNFRENKKLINKQMQAIDEQIAASKEYRQQRADEIARLNKVRKNTQKAFNTGTTITRSY